MTAPCSGSPASSSAWTRAPAIRSASPGPATTGRRGFIGLWLDPRLGANLGYWVAPGARGHGLAARAVALVSAWAFARLRLARLEIWVEPANIASQRVAERAGFVHEGLLRSYVQLRTRRGDAHMYALLPPGARVNPA